MLWIKQFRSKKLQSVMIFMIIGLCALLMSGSLIILTSLKKPYQDLYAETKAADVRIHPNSVTVESEEWIDKLLDIDGVSAVEEVTKYPVDALFVGGEREDAFIDIVEYNPEVYKNTRMLDGSFENLENQTCAIPSVIANLYDLEIGDEFSIKIEDTMVTYEVGAIFADVYSISNAFTMDIIVKTLPEQVPYVAKGYLVWLENEYTNLEFLKDYTMGNDGISQVIYNLIENGIKYNENVQKEIHLKVWYDEFGHRIFISIKDNGLGIQMTDIPYVFQAFYRAEKSRSIQIPGSGLGLSICKRIVEAHDGEIEVKSKTNVGSEFIFYLQIC